MRGDTSRYKTAIYGFDVDGSMDGDYWYPINADRKPFTTGMKTSDRDIHKVYKVDFGTAHIAKYVKLILTPDQW